MQRTQSRVRYRRHFFVLQDCGGYPDMNQTNPSKPPYQPPSLYQTNPLNSPKHSEAGITRKILEFYVETPKK
jgi:hypothetical protein